MLQQPCIHCALCVWPTWEQEDQPSYSSMAQMHCKPPFLLGTLSFLPATEGPDGEGKQANE